MSPKWIKALVLIFVVAVLLTVAGVTTPKNQDENTTAPVSEKETAAADPGSANPFLPTPTDKPNSDLNGWIDSNGTSYYYVNGVLQKNTIVGSDTDGYVYLGANGAKDAGYCNAVTVDEIKWNVIEGTATRVEDEWDETLYTALTYVGQWTDSSMSREQKLRKAFETIKDENVFLEGVPDRDGEPYYELNWPVVCANELLTDGMGDCYSYGAAFAFIGKGIGYDECYACTTGGHGWAIIEGKAYDPEWDAHHQEYNHFGVAPEDDCDVSYFNSLTEGVDWMKVRV